MKKVTSILAAILIVLSLSSFGQISVYKTEGISFKHKDYQTAQWKSWEEWQISDVTIVHDKLNNKFVVRGENIEFYTIINTFTKAKDNHGDEIMEWECLNNNGAQVLFRDVTFTSLPKQKKLLRKNEYHKQFYIITDSMKTSYILK